MPSEPEPSPWRYAGLGLELGGVVAVLAWLGYAFDQWKGTAPWGVLVGSTIGIVGGLYNLVKRVIREQGSGQGEGRSKR